MLSALGFPGCGRVEPHRLIIPVGSETALQRQDLAGVDTTTEVPLRDVAALC